MSNIMRAVVVLYNRSVKAMMDGLQPSDFLEKVHDGWMFESPDDVDALRSIFYRFNHNPPLKRRSLSTGDVVTIDHVSYECRPNGWERLPLEVKIGIYVKIGAANPMIIIERDRQAVRRDIRGRRLGNNTPDFQQDSDTAD